MSGTPSRRARRRTGHRPGATARRGPGSRPGHRARRRRPSGSSPTRRPARSPASTAGTAAAATRTAVSVTSVSCAPKAAITAAVISTYGRDTSRLVRSSLTPAGRHGAISINAVMNWLDTSPAIDTADPVAGPCTVTGRCPHPAPAVTVAPSSTSASWSGPNSLRRSAGRPSIVTGARPSAASAVRNLDVVPASAACTSAGPIASGSGTPAIVTRPSTDSTPAPSALRPSTMAVVSSPSGTFVSSLVPAASAAHTNARLAIDFDPGTATTASISPPSGRSRRESSIRRAG